MDVLETGFDLLTVNKEIFDIWQKATMAIEDGQKVVVDMTVLGVYVSFYTGGSMLGPIGVAAVGGILYVMSAYFHDKNSNEMIKIKNRTFFSRIPSALCY